MDRIIKKAVNPIKGEVNIPGDKSISHRAVIISALSEGTSEVENFLFAGDTLSTLDCLAKIGVEIDIDERGCKVRINGRSLRGFVKPGSMLDAGNSGTTIRLLTGVLVGQKFDSIITGDASLRRRPMGRIIRPLSMMGARIRSTPGETPPLEIYGVEKLDPIEYYLELPSAQVKSCIIFAGLYSDGITKIIERIPSRDHTERMLGLKIENLNGRRIIQVDGGIKIEGRYYFIPNDISSAAFFIVAGLIIPGSNIVIRNVGLNPTRIGFIEVLKKMGGNIYVENYREISGEPVGDIIVRSDSEIGLKNLKLSGRIIPNIIDEIPVLAIAGALGEGIFEVRDAMDLRNKESDRIKAVVENLRKMGVDVEEYDDGFAFEGVRRLRGAIIRSFNDHRIAMAFSIAGLVADGETIIMDSDCVNVSFPDFYRTLDSILKF